jgi:CRISPR-associated protein Cmr4
MYKIAKPFFIKAITPLHVGSGQDLGIIDMPIQRERHTGFPKIEGSSLKGSIREVFREKERDDKDKKKANLAFGPDSEDSGDYAGSLGFTDARLLFFPVKSVKGVFAYISCPMILKRLENDLGICKNTGAIKTNFKIPKYFDLKNGKCIVSSNSDLLINNENVILEEYSFKLDKEVKCSNELFANIDSILNTPEIENKLAIVADDDFTDFVNLSTEVITRTRIDVFTGTVQNGMLFTEEYLPAETVMYSLFLTTSVFKNDEELNFKTENDIKGYFENGIPNIIQIGGNATIGKGIVEIKMWMEDNNDK